jgi:hypothetical protein
MILLRGAFLASGPVAAVLKSYMNTGCDLVQIGNDVVVYLIAVNEHRQFLVGIASQRHKKMFFNLALMIFKNLPGKWAFQASCAMLQMCNC